MKVALRCSACRRGFVVEESSLAEGLPCPACGAALASDVTQSATAAAPRSSSARQEGEAEVVCPRCNLHFVPRAAQRPGPPVDRPRVLVVEDIDYFREVAVEVLGERCEVRTATSASEAWSVLAGGGIDLLVLDLTLDGQERGMDLLRGLRNKPCPILIYTEKDESEIYGEDWETLRGLGADDIVIKGLQVGESLKRKAGALLGRDWDEDD